MQLQHIVIDDFFDQPMQLREQILSFDFPERDERELYPGRNSSHMIQLPGLERVISDIVREHVKAAPNSSHQRPRLALEGDVGRNMSVHMDMCHWSAMVYLTLNEHCQGGTHFFRHKKTGWDMAPVWPGMAESAGYASPDEALKTVMADTNSPEAWDETMLIPMKFNRLAMFRGYLWHDAGVSFGDSVQNGRLILPLFFDALQ